MRTLKPGEIAQYCDVHQRTVSRWIASGQLKGHKLPGRGNYRVLLADFINFLHLQQIPLPVALQSFDNSSVDPVRKCILIIDDEVAMQKAVRRVLLPSQHEVILARDGFQAGVKIVAEKPDLIILDLSMPGVDGFEMIRFIRQRPDLARLKILVLSDSAPTELAQFIGLGANDAMAKPVDSGDLLNKVNLLLS